jgi:hypothetical protein
MSEQWDPMSYLKRGYNPDQIKEIRVGLDMGVDVSKYCGPEFSWAQIRLVCL